ncbi:hypothetical protein [Synechococcus elongatus]|uniref:hypothetical protein n=1 Tax=Synechococcus elongatus TaxID=32046 RepID=UPI000F7DCD0D|nr:hypothetical protein [Synechococcus elongatus]
MKKVTATFIIGTIFGACSLSTGVVSLASTSQECKKTNDINTVIVTGNIRENPSNNNDSRVIGNSLKSAVLTIKKTDPRESIDVTDNKILCWYEVDTSDLENVGERTGWVAHTVIETITYDDRRKEKGSTLLISASSETKNPDQSNRSANQNNDLSIEDSRFLGFLEAPGLDWNLLQLLTFLVVVGVAVSNHIYQKKRHDEFKDLLRISSSQIAKSITLEQLERSLHTALRSNNTQILQELQTQIQGLLRTIEQILAEVNSVPRNKSSSLALATSELYSAQEAVPALPTSLVQQVISSFGKSNQLFSDNRFSPVSFPSGFVPSSLMCDPQGRPSAKLAPSTIGNSLFLQFEDGNIIYLVPNIFLNQLPGKIAHPQAGFEVFFDIVGTATPMARIELEQPARIELNGIGDCSILQKGKLIFT